jgi:hypothetical protein
MTDLTGRRIGLLMLVACAALSVWCIVKTLAWLEVEPEVEVVTFGPGPVPPIPSEADIIAHGMNSSVEFGGYAERTLPNVDKMTKLIPSGAVELTHRNRTITLPDMSGEYMTKDSLERDLKLRIVCREEKVTGKQVNPSSTTAWVPCSRIDQLWMDGQLVWQRPKK